MKQILLAVIFLIPLYAAAQQSIVVDHLSELYAQKTADDVNQVFVTDQNDGGMFYRYKGAAAVDSGIIISDAAGNKFKRQFDEAGAISPLWWGAKGNAIADDLPALKKATNYLGMNGGTIDLKNKYYRITDTWILGERFIDEKNSYNSNPTRSPDYIHAKYMGALSRKPIKIISSGYAGIYGDFNSATPKAIIYYSLYGDTRAHPSAENYAAEITNIGIYGKGSFKNGKPFLANPDSAFTYAGNQIGLLAINTFEMKINNITCYGVKDGMVLNNSYFSTVRSCYFKFCDRGIYHIQSHGSVIDNPVTYFCNKGYEIRSGQISMININSEHCKIGLHIINGSNVVNGAYLESMGNAGVAQLIIGDDNGSGCEGVVLNAVTIAAIDSKKKVATGVLLKKTAGTVIINGGAITGYQRDSSAATLLLSGVAGSHPAWAYERSSDVTARNISAAGNITAKGILSGSSLNVPIIKTSTINVKGTVSVDGEMIMPTPLNKVVVKSKIITGIGGSKDYIIRLGKYSVADSSRIEGTLSILGNGVYTAGGFININYVNEAASGNVQASFAAMTNTKNLSVSLIKYTDGKEVWAGIRCRTNATVAWMPYYFIFNGALNDGAVPLSSIATSSVSDIVPLLANDSKYELNVNQIVTPNLKSNSPGVKKAIYVDEFGNWSVQ
jgi:hypothetical protein